MHDAIHIDEKWFYSCKDRTGFYLVPDWDDEPKRSVISKRQIQKVMFLVAVCRPRMNERGEWFDGKIDMWPFVEWLPALKNSKNRKAGTMCPHHVTVKSAVYEKFIIDKVLPAIKKKCPAMMKRNTIYLQMDNASSHKCISDKNPRFVAACKALKLDCVSHFQPPNSPDLNILDLAFFNSLAKDTMFSFISNNPRAIIRHVHASFLSYDSIKIDKAFMTLQSVMNMILEVRGCNFFKIPHLKKDQMQREKGKLEQGIEAYKHEGVFNQHGYPLAGMEVHIDRTVPMVQDLDGSDDDDDDDTVSVDEADADEAF
jgi:hypothetical protein